MVTMPTINDNGTSLVELLEQHELAIAGLRSAISTLAAAAPNCASIRVSRVPHQAVLGEVADGAAS